MLLVGERSWLRRDFRSIDEALELLVTTRTEFDGWLKRYWFAILNQIYFLCSFDSFVDDMIIIGDDTADI